MNLRCLTAVFALILPFAAQGDVPAGSAAEVTKRLARPVPAVERVLIVSVDGLRPDCVLRAHTPTIRQLMAEGSFSFWAKTTAVSITLPSHTSMLTGVVPGKHGVEWNRDLPFTEPVYPRVPTLFEMAREAGYTTAMVAGKSKFVALCRPGGLNWSSVPESTKAGNAEVAAAAVRLIDAHRPELLFVHFPETDSVGHSKGWGSAEQLACIEEMDRLLATVLAALDRAGLRDKTAIILTADHGGAGLTHGADDPRSRHIPWIISGPGVNRNLDLAGIAKLEVRVEDTCATAAYLLGLPQKEYFDGHPVHDAIARVP